MKKSAKYCGTKTAKSNAAEFHAKWYGCLGQTKHRGQVCVDVKLLSRLILSTFKIVLLKGIRQLLGVLNFKRIADQKMPLVYARVRLRFVVKE